MEDFDMPENTIDFSEHSDFLPLNEMLLTPPEKTNVRVSVSLLLSNGATFDNALSIAEVLLTAMGHDITPTPEFLADHLENDPRIYSSNLVYVAFYLLMLAGKVSNHYYVEEELKSGIADSFSVTCPCDKESCSLCVARYMEGYLDEITYQKLPPYHVGCRCGLLFHKRGKP